MLLCFAVVCAGCAHAVLRPSPKRTAPAARRLAAYQALRPAATATEITVTVARPHVAVTSNERLILADGTTVEHADDLLPVLDPDTPSAKAARRSGTARTRHRYWTAGAIAVGLGGAILSVAGMQPYECVLPEDPCYDPNAEAYYYGGLAMMSVAVLAGAVAWLYYRDIETSNRSAAFATYDESLRDSLGLCLDGLHVIACEDVGAPASVPPPEPAPPPPPPPPPVIRGGDEDTIPFPTSPPPSPTAPRPDPAPTAPGE